MSALDEAIARLSSNSAITLIRKAPLSGYTRFGIGGPAALLADTADTDALLQIFDVGQSTGVPQLVIGGGTNLVVSDCGFDGIVVRFRGAGIEQTGNLLRVEAGAVLQDVVDASIARGLDGLHTMTGIPGYLGGAVYGNAGAYGRSIQEIIRYVYVLDAGRIRALDNSECEFTYRESIFKRRKEWVIAAAELLFQPGDPAALSHTATEIRSIRDAKYPPAMRCAGSIFKNVFLQDLPPHVQVEVPAKLVREGKVPSAWFLEQADVKGMRIGDIQVASYHANLIYNDGAGNAKDLVTVIHELKRRVRDRFGFDLEEEVQYVGFDGNERGC